MGLPGFLDTASVEGYYSLFRRGNDRRRSMARREASRVVEFEFRHGPGVALGVNYLSRARRALKRLRWVA